MRGWSGISNLYGRLRGNRGEVTRTGTTEITAVLETWTCKVVLTMFADGTFLVETAEKYAPSGDLAYKGNANERGA